MIQATLGGELRLFLRPTAVGAQMREEDRSAVSVGRLRRLPRLSIRGLIIAVLVIGGALGWWLHGVRLQRDAVAAIRRAGGAADYDPVWTSSFASREPLTRRWLADQIGVEYVAPVTCISLGPISTATDAALAQVARLDRVERLHLDKTSITDAGLVHLEGLDHLSELYLSDTKISDAGLAHLKGLRNLTVLRLGGTQVTGTGLGQLKELTRVYFLDLAGAPVSDGGLAHLKELTSLPEVDLRGTQVTDAGLVHLVGMTNLRRLNLSKTQVTDAGLAHLKGVVDLKVLFAAGTRVTDTGVKELEQALPNLRVIR
jgi:internalin A